MRLYKFEKKGCGPCKMAGMLIEKIISKTGVELVSFDVMENEAKKEEYKITSVPTVIIADNDGKEIKRFSNFGEIAAQLEKTVLELK